MSLWRSTAAAVAVIAVAALGAAPASGDPSPDAVSLYLDAPFVQGSYVTGTAGTTTETFDSFGINAPCTSPLAVGPITGTCTVQGADPYGGASASSATPTIGGAGSNYANAGGDSVITITLAEPSRYFGFWWSAGSASNAVSFYSDGQLVLDMTTETISTLIGAYPGSGTLNSIGADSYPRSHYFGNPRGHETLSPSGESSLSATEPFAYIHLFATGSFTFDEVIMSGSGFEFDNLVISTLAQTPRSELVLVERLTGTPRVTFDANGGFGSMRDQVSLEPMALAPNSFTRAGYAFTGWSTTADGSGEVYNDEAIYAFDESVTLYAQWLPEGATLAATGSEIGPWAAGLGAALATVGAVLLAATARRRASA